MAPNNGSAAAKGMTDREDVIETLIDLDPCGAAYRFTKTMVRTIIIFLSVKNSYTHCIIVIFAHESYLIYIIPYLLHP